MVDNQPQTSRLRRVIAFIVFIFIPTLILIVSAWLSIDVVAAASAWLAQRNAYYAELDSYAQQATEIAPGGDDSAAGGIALMGYHPQQEPTDVPLALATNTPRPTEIPVTIPSVNTAMPTEPAATPTIEPVSTLVLPTLIFPEDAPADIIASAPTAVPTRIAPITRNYDLVNIVLLGSDEEITNDNTIRTDTMIVVSINRETGTVNMLSLPRDLFVYVPGLGMRRLNVAFGWGDAVGWTAGGFGLLRDTLIYNLGINIHYYAKVNITEFEQIVDMLGGVEIAVDCAYQDWYPIAPIEELDLTRPIEENYYLRTLDVGYYRLDGFDAQWYARSRKNSSDFDRGRRQQKLVRAIFRQALNEGRVADVPSLWNEGMEIVETNLSRTDVISLLPIAVNLSSSDIESFTLIPTYHTTSWTSPDGSNVQLPVYETMIPLLEDFYSPPSENQINLNSATVRVFNGTSIADLDRVATEALIDAGFLAFAGGPTEAQDRMSSVMIDYTGDTKGSSAGAIAEVLNMPVSSITDEPNPNREYDYDVILGADYNSCPGGVLPVEETE